MLRLTPIPSKEGSIELQQILGSSRVVAGDTPNFLRILAISSAALKAYVESKDALSKGQLTRRFREQIALAVAEINACNYCLATHSIAAKKAGLTDEEIRLARHAAASDPKSEAMLRFTQGFVLQRGRISDADFCALVQAGFSQVEIVEIMTNIVLNIFTNYFNLAAKTEIESPPAKSNGDTAGKKTPNQTIEPLPPTDAKEEFLKSHPFLKGFSPHLIEILADYARLAHFEAGEEILGEGDPADRFYLIKKGHVALETYVKGRGIVVVQTIGPGDTLGWSWLFPQCFWHLTARALEATDAVFIDGSSLREECDLDHELGYKLFKGLAAVMLQQLQASRAPLLEPQDPRGDPPQRDQSISAKL